MQRLLLAVAVLLITATPAFARSSDDHATVGGDITIAEGEVADDIACVFCTVKIHGDVKGDIAVLFGSITVDPDHSIKGDVAMLGGDLNLGESAEVGGDVAIAAGDAKLASGADIRGSRTILPGALWLIVPFLPLIFLVGIIWLIVYLVRGRRYRFPVYPQGRGF
jgi:hypothetical protein